MLRIFAYSRTNAPICEIQESQVVSAKLHEEINGEHSLALVTTQKLDKGCRLVFKTAGRGGVEKWHEYSIAGINGDHHIGGTVLYTYYCVWSVQEDLQGVMVSAMPGVQTPVAAQVALAAALSSQTRWAAGTSRVGTTGGASMYDRTAWDALSVLVENWGGEIAARLAVSPTSGVTARYVDLLPSVGENTTIYSFYFGSNVSSITRTVDDAPYYCRITPRGKGEQTEGGGYGRKVTIESVNGGDDCLTYDGMLNEALLNNPDGTTLYPTLKIENSKCETPEELKAWAQSVIADYCTPKVSYTVDAYRAVREDGTDDGYLDLQLGDNVYVVDEGFEGGLRFESRIVAMDRDLLDERNNVVQISNAKQSISSKFANLGGSGGGKESRETHGDGYTDGSLYVSGNVTCDGDVVDGDGNKLSSKMDADALDPVSENLTRESAASSWTSGQVRRCGHVVVLTINSMKLASALNSGATSGAIATVPTGYRPNTLQRVPACIGTAGNYGNAWFAISAYGSVVLRNASATSIPTTAEVSCNVTYIVD